MVKPRGSGQATRPTRGRWWFQRARSWRSGHGAVTGEVTGLSLSLRLLDEELDRLVTEVSQGTQI